MKWSLILGVLCLCALGPARAADHRDAPGAKQDPSSDINDVFAWMSADGSKVYLGMTVFPNANIGSRFSDKVQYVFHTVSKAARTAGAAMATDVICVFDTAQVAECWVGKDGYLKGAVSDPRGLVSADGKVRAFAGLRDDPFFFNLDGFQTAMATVRASKASLAFDDAGCPKLDDGTRQALLGQLTQAPDGTQARNFFKSLNTLALVLAVDKGLLARGGPILGVWASTNKR